MAALTFLAGVLVGALLAFLLDHADTMLSSENWDSKLPTSPIEAIAQIHAKWTTPTLVLIAVLKHPLRLLLALALLLSARRCWRSIITRNLWIRCPNKIKAALESHASLLGVIVIAATLGAASITLAAAMSDPIELEISNLLAIFWPHAHLLSGLLVQASLPLAIHPQLAPQLLDALSWGWLNGGLPVPIVRRGLRIVFGMLLLLSVLWIIPLTFEAGVRWWQEEAILYLREISGSLPSLAATFVEEAGPETSASHVGSSGPWWFPWASPSVAHVRTKVQLASLRATMEDGKAHRAAATLRTLALFSMLRRVGKSIDLQLGHYYGSSTFSGNGRIEERTAAAMRRQANVISIGKVGRARSLLRAIGSPQWLKSSVRSLRWLAVTPPTYLFWYALSLEMAGARGWRRLLLPVLLFALNECCQTIRLFVLLVVHERYAQHEHLRLRSAHWLHRLELAAALHWMTLAAHALASTLVATALDSSLLSWLIGWAAFVLGDGLFGPPPPRVGVLLGLPAACLVGVTWLEQLPGNASEIKVLLRNAARVNEPGDLKHLVSGNAWYRGLLDLFVMDPEALTDVVELDAAQRSLPWWLRPPLPDSTDLRSSRLNLAALASSSTGNLQGISLVAGAFTDDAHESALSVLDSERETLSGMGRALGGSRMPTKVRRVVSGNSLPIINRKPSTEPLEATLRRVPSHRVLLLALSKPVGGLTTQLFDSLPKDLGDSASEVWAVALSSFFGQNGERSEYYISEALRVFGTLTSFVIRSHIFSWVGRRKLLGGIAELEEMIDPTFGLRQTEEPPDTGDDPLASDDLAADPFRADPGKRFRMGHGQSVDAPPPLPVISRRFRRRHKSSRGASTESMLPRAMPHLLHLLAARERRYMEKVREHAEPVGRHGTGAGRLAARDPLSFGFVGSIVLDDLAMKVLKERRRERERQAADGSDANGGSAVASAANDVSSRGSAVAEPPKASGLMGWLQERFDETMRRFQAAPVQTTLLEELGVTLAHVYEISPRVDRLEPRDSGPAEGADGGGRARSVGAAADLCEAAFCGDVARLRALVGTGLDVNRGDYDHRTALHLAASEGHTETIRILSEEFNADCDVVDRWGNTPLDDARSWPLAATLLRSKGALSGKQARASSRDDFSQQPMSGRGTPEAAFMSEGASSLPRSYVGRMQELQARDAQAGVSGTSVKVLRYPPKWSCTPEAARGIPPTTPTTPSHGGAMPPAASAAGAPSAAKARTTGSTSALPPLAEERPLWFFATVTAIHEATQTVDLEYQNVALEARFGDGCDTGVMNILLPELCISLEGLAVDLVDRSSRHDASGDDRAHDRAHRYEFISARWSEPGTESVLRKGLVAAAAELASRTGRDHLAAAAVAAAAAAASAVRAPEPHEEAAVAGEHLGTLELRLQRPILFNVTAEAARLTLLGKGNLSFLNAWIGVRNLVRIEADVQLSAITVNLTCRADGVFWSISEIEMEVARDSDVKCHSVEGGFVEWIVRAYPAKVLEWIKKALQDNLRKEQLLCKWKGDATTIGALDRLFRELERLAELKAAHQAHSARA